MERSARGLPKERERPQVLTVLNLPSLEPLRTIAVPGRDLREAVISPDGRLVACESSPAGSYRGPVVVFDVASGAEIARRKVDQVGALAFLRDSRTVAVANTGMTTSEAVALWTLPTV